MNKSNTLIKRIFAVLLSFLLVLSVLPTADAVTIIHDEDKLQYLLTFNSAVNSIKEKKPSFSYYKQTGINSTEDISVNSSSYSDNPEEIQEFLSIIVNSFFDPEKGLINNFLANLSGTDNSITEKDIAKNIDTRYLLPKYGKNYVSALTVDDDYYLDVTEQTDLLNPQHNMTTLTYKFADGDLENVAETSVQKLYDLPSGSINPVLIGGKVDLSDADGPLADIKFDTFKYHDAKTQAVFNADGQLIKYTQNISYTFSLSFYDLLRVLRAYSSVDLIGIGFAIANGVLKATGNPEGKAEEVLRDSCVYIRYDIKLELTDFDWNPRYFGDINNDNKVNANDARTILRCCVELEEFKDDESLMYADVDFNGKITSADARTVLRMSVELEDLFNEVPEGETIKIIEIAPSVPDEPDEEPDEPETPETPDEPEDTGPSPEEIFANGITDFIDGIIDVVNAAKGEEVEDSVIGDMIGKIRDIIEQAKNTTF